VKTFEICSRVIKNIADVNVQILLAMLDRTLAENMKGYLIIFSFILITISCSQGRVASDSSKKTVSNRFPESFPLVKVVEDHSPPFSLDSTKPFIITFGKGDGLLGMDTIEIDEHGTVILQRIQMEQRNGVWYPFKEAGTMQLLPEDTKSIIDSLHTFHILEMHKEYHADIYDGMKWALWIQQEPHEKSIYCNNHFPENILAFSDFIDELLTKRGLADVNWTRVPEHESRNHEKELRESTK
jgi:hypothetical protein